MDDKKPAMTLAARVLIGFASVCFILFLVVTVSLWQVQKVEKITEHLIEVDFPTIAASMELASLVDRSSNTLRGWMLTGQAEYKQERYMIWETSIPATLMQITQLSKNWTIAKNKERLKTITEKLPVLKQAQQDIEDLAPKNLETATKLFIDQATPTRRAIHDL